DGISNSGGTDRVLSMISNMFVLNNNKVTVFSLNDSIPYYKISTEVKIISPSTKGRLAKLMSFVRHVKVDNPDIIIVVSMGRLSAQIIPLLKVFKCKSEIICYDHVSIESFPTYIRMIKRIAYYLADKIVVLTDSDKRFIQDNYKIDNVYVIRNPSPFDENTIEPSELQHKIKKILAVGRLTYQKNFHRLINQRLELNNIKIKKPDKNIQLLYKESSILVMTSRYEGLPMVLIESKNFGLPVIAFDCKTGPAEIISNDGYLVDYSNDCEFLIKLEKLMFNHELRKELSLNAIKNSKNYSCENIYLQWLSVLK
ncbi:glycosyltransferase, partial [Klebsiella pneumoniae]|uniref:glycosyltransferase n=1 Tax=Klebsiella pneumoniae TaxID=573 RepID=UPI00115DB4BC